MEWCALGRGLLLVEEGMLVIEAEGNETAAPRTSAV